MSAHNEIEEEAMGMQDTGGTEPVTGQTMLGESPLRPKASLFGVNQLADGSAQYVFGPSEGRSPPIERPRSVSPSMRLVEQGVVVHNDEITDISRMPNYSPNDSNGADIGVEEDDNMARGGSRVVIHGRGRKRDFDGKDRTV